MATGNETIVTAVVIDEVALTLDELAHACAVEPGWVVQRVRTGVLLETAPDDHAVWRFTSADLVLSLIHI